MRNDLSQQLSELAFNKQYQIKVTNRFAGLENLNDSEGINRDWENSKGNIKPRIKRASLYKLRQHKPLFVEECLGLLHQRNEDKMQLLQDPNESDVDNPNSAEREAGRHIRNKWKEYLIAKINDLESNIKLKKYQRILYMLYIILFYYNIFYCSKTRCYSLL